LIHVEGLTRRYGDAVAVDHIHFEVPHGQVVGFLGPNGAGKTTTIRILVGVLAPTAGKVRVAGHDIVADSLAARARIGYVPEVVALYTEMTVGDYLEHMARLRRLPNPAARVTAVAEACHLADKLTTYIWKLSHGYRQRVGLAQALIHDPEVLILDEPTTGLDPLQIREIRELVRGLGGRRTVLLSTHILAEAEQVCDRALIIHRGKIAGDCVLSDCGRATRTLSVRLQPPQSGACALLASVAGVVHVEASPDVAGDYRVTCRAEAEPEADIAALVVRQGWKLVQLSSARTQLEDIFARAIAGRGA
jgi:ABC-2 type transport system ATP-binding protein